MSAEQQPPPASAHPSSRKTVTDIPLGNLRTRTGDRTKPSTEGEKDTTTIVPAGPVVTQEQDIVTEGDGSSDVDDVETQQEVEGNVDPGSGSKSRSHKQPRAGNRESVAHRQEEKAEGGEVRRKLRGLGQTVRRYPNTMSTFGLPALTCVLGAVVTYIWVGPQQVTYPVPDNIVETLTKDDGWFGEVLKKHLKERTVEQHIRQIMSDALREDETKQDSQPAWTMSEEQWKAVEQQQKECEAKLIVQETQMAEIIKNASRNITLLKNNMLVEMGAMRNDLKVTFEQNLKDAEKVTNSKIERERDKIGKVEEHVGETPQRMENIGFLKIDSIGPILVVLVTVEALLGLGMCILCGRHVTRTTSEPRQKVSKVTQPQPRAQPSLINTNSTNVLCLCFRDADEALSKALGNEIVESCDSGRLQLRAFVVNSMEDVQEIPACRVALVFVDPDEREMIIEDERYHIGQGLRRHAVQRLLDSGVEVFIIIYNDRRSANLRTSQLYNPKLGQVDEHAQLKRLKRKERVVSIQDRFHEHQSALLIREINAAFG